MKVITKVIKSMAMEYINGQMGHNIKDFIKMI